ncbi:hypothetical protein HYFRA_00005798 [Hymenoscyphus fraxineus]|uniref:Celp0028 effector like protein n=1 Tax=Hymenoscyphus fraxineus TaxID=746836 RepID=A0A9N9KX24_9HELO|nr:hypothetical protein HYFRA_00005798 [Hymenoscyphus fraxineus]
MYLAPFIGFALASTCATVSASALIPRALSVDEMLAFVDGEIQVVNKAAYLTETDNLMPPPNFTHSLHNRDTFDSSLVKRDCKRKQDIIVSTNIQRFLGDDVPMSTAIKADSTDVTIAVTDGYEIGNSITTSTTGSLNFFSEMLGISFGVEKGRTWTSSYSTAYTFTVPKGKYGVVVSNLWTNRHEGYKMTGCVGEVGEKISYSSDSYESGEYSKLSWPKGTISICISEEYPVKKCRGDGFVDS